MNSRWSANLCTSLLSLLLSLETIAGDSAETVAGDSRWSQYRVSRWSLGPEQLLRSTAVYTEMIVRSMIRWTLTCRCTTLWLSPTESLSHLALRGPPALSRPALALPRRAQDRPPNRPDARALPQQLSERAQPTTLPPAPPGAAAPPPPRPPFPLPLHPTPPPSDVHSRSASRLAALVSGVVAAECCGSWCTGGGAGGAGYEPELGRAVRAGRPG